MRFYGPHGNEKSKQTPEMGSTRHSFWMHRQNEGKLVELAVGQISQLNAKVFYSTMTDLIDVKA